MASFIRIIQTVFLSVSLVGCFKIASVIRRLVVRQAKKNRYSYNKKHGYPPNRCMGEIDETSLSYQIATAEGYFVFVCIIVFFCLLFLVVPAPQSDGFGIAATIISSFAFFRCIRGFTNCSSIWRITLAVSSLLSVAFIIVALIANTKENPVLYLHNCISICMFLWTTLMFYKIFFGSVIFRMKP